MGAGRAAAEEEGGAAKVGVEGDEEAGAEEWDLPVAASLSSAREREEGGEEEGV